MHNKIFIFLVSVVFLSLTIVFNFFPRSTFSELERRELATFPEFDMEKLKDGSFNKSVSSWYSDSEPYREHFMAIHMDFKDRIRLRRPLAAGDEVLAFHASDDPVPVQNDVDEDDGKEIKEYKNELTQDEKSKITSRGTLVVGSAPNARALMVYGGSGKSGVAYANAANKYKETFGDAVNVYCMVIPTSTDYYLPESARKVSKPFLPTIKNVHEHLAPGVKPVDVYTILGKHASEPIFLRTDHHWAPRGAYYAAKKFAEAAGVPFKDLSTYDENVIHDYVGTMYGFSKDINVKKSPEDFIYYTPKGVDYTTTYITYTLDKKSNIIATSKPTKGEFFHHFKDGSPSAYLTFMGGDYKITQVRTSTKNGRRAMIIKDSFGNAIPGYLFHSFEEVHVVDARYFNKNMRRYVKDNQITDILFAFNIFNVCTDSRSNAIVKFLDQ